MAVTSTIGKIIAVTSCKGGVGKSSVSFALAYELAGRGHRVGIFDADVHGPSLPAQVPKAIGNKLLDLTHNGYSITPLVYRGVKLMSFGFLNKLWMTGNSGETAEIRTGYNPGNIANLLLNQTHWDQLDYLVIDSPPGTGDIPRTLYQSAPISSAIVVTTPSSLATADVVRGIEMLRRYRIPIVGIVENMASFTCGNCSEVHFPFGRGHIEDVLKNIKGRIPVFSLPIGGIKLNHLDGSSTEEGMEECSNANMSIRSINKTGLGPLCDVIEREGATSDNKLDLSANKATLPHKIPYSLQAHWPTVKDMASATTC